MPVQVSSTIGPNRRLRRGIAVLKRRRLPSFLDPALLDFERRLPEKQIRADRGPEHGHQHQDGVAIPGQTRDDGRKQHLVPGHVHDERGGDVSEQHERQQFHVLGVPPIGDRDLRREADHSETQRVDRRRPANEDLHRRGHGCDVGGDVDHVGGGQERNNCEQQHGRDYGAEIGRQSPPGDRADTRAHDLDRDHERRGQKHRPAQRVTELGATLRIGRNATGIVVGGAGQKPGPHAPVIF